MTHPDELDVFIDFRPFTQPLGTINKSTVYYSEFGSIIDTPTSLHLSNLCKLTLLLVLNHWTKLDLSPNLLPFL